jgi:hypothetical protein
MFLVLVGLRPRLQFNRQKPFGQVFGFVPEADQLEWEAWRILSPTF